jgi:hypothetical protein
VFSLLTLLADGRRYWQCDGAGHRAPVLGRRRESPGQRHDSQHQRNCRSASNRSYVLILRASRLPSRSRLNRAGRRLSTAAEQVFLGRWPRTAAFCHEGPNRDSPDALEVTGLST